MKRIHHKPFFIVEVNAVWITAITIVECLHKQRLRDITCVRQLIVINFDAIQRNVIFRDFVVLRGHRHFIPPSLHILRHFIPKGKKVTSYQPLHTPALHTTVRLHTKSLHTSHFIPSHSISIHYIPVHFILVHFIPVTTN